MSIQQSQSSKEVDVIISLLEDVEGQADRLASYAPENQEQVKATIANVESLISGDLRIAYKQSNSLAGEEANFCRAMCLYTEADLRRRFHSAQGGARGKQAAKDATRLAEESLALFDDPDHHQILGLLYTHQEMWDKARVAYEKASKSDDPAIATESQKELLRLKEKQHAATDPMLRMESFAKQWVDFTKRYPRALRHAVVALISFTISQLHKERDIIWLFFVLVALNQFCTSIYWFYKIKFRR